MQRPAWWNYPLKCENDHEWGAGLVIVGWMPCACLPAREAQARGPGHLYVSCHHPDAPDCPAIWYQPAHDPATIRR
jgi:hypothetical protein